MRRPRLTRWLLRITWLVLAFLGYTSLVDVGSEGLAGSHHMLFLFLIYAAGDGLMDWLWPRIQRPNTPPHRARAVDQ